MRPQHTIRKFSLELQLAGQQESYQLQRRAAALIKETMLNELDAVLTTCFPGEDHTRIGRIELNLGTIGADVFEHVFVEHFISQLRTRLLSLQAAVYNKQTGDDIPEHIPATVHVLQQLLHFLAHGTIAFAGSTPAVKSWEQHIEQALRERPQMLAALSARYVSFHRTMAERMLLQFEPSFVEAVLELLAPGIKGMIERLHQLEKQVQQHSFAVSMHKKILAVLVYYVLQSDPDRATVILQQIITQLNEAEKQGTSLRTMTNIPAGIAVLLQPVYPVAAMTLPVAKEDKSPDVNVQELPQQQPAQDMPGEVAEESVFIDNAGLVLLHPFLPGFFKTLQLMQDGRFVNEQAQYKAVHLLQYLANGEEETPEYCVLINKILCGLRSDQHIDRFVQLSDVEKQEAHNLLQAVVEHWAALKNSSPEALQQTFLQRKGKLRFVATDHYWKLQVEQKAFDILLDKLPWGFSYIQLSWMENPLVTEWQ